MTFVPKPDVCQPSGSAELAMLDVYMPMMKSAAIISAGRLGLFEALAKDPLPLPELAAKIQSSLQGTATLADFLVVIGYLEKQGECIANTASTQRRRSSCSIARRSAAVLSPSSPISAAAL